MDLGQPIVAGELLRAAVALPLVLFLPGYALTRALFPRQSLGVVEQLVFSVGLSLMVTMLGGLVLHLTPFGLQPTTWAALIILTTLAGGLIAARRNSVELASRSVRSSLNLSYAQCFLLITGAALALGAVMVASTAPAAQPDQGYSQLWLLPPQGPTDQPVRIGVKNLESAPTRYQLTLRIDGDTIAEWPEIALTPGRQWETMVALPAGTGQELVEAVLVRAAGPEEIYRRASFWRTSAPAETTGLDGVGTSPDDEAMPE